jgi:hypothetical protein
LNDSDCYFPQHFAKEWQSRGPALGWENEISTENSLITNRAYVGLTGMCGAVAPVKKYLRIAFSKLQEDIMVVAAHFLTSSLILIDEREKMNY